MVHAVHHPTGPDIDAFPPTEPIELPLQPALRLERVGFDSYAVCRDAVTVGFIDVIGRIHVVYIGARVDRAVELTQTLDIATALDRLAAAL